MPSALTHLNVFEEKLKLTFAGFKILDLNNVYMEM